jgi:hypothetical protein
MNISHQEIHNAPSSYMGGSRVKFHYQIKNTKHSAISWTKSYDAVLSDYI